jgi:hypothetical protein
VADNELTITIHDRRRLSVDRSDDVDVDDAEVDLDSLRRATIEMFQRWLGEEKGKITYRPDLEVLGRHLYAVLFGGAAGTALDDMLGKAERGQRLRLQLDFRDDAVSLARYPWEFLYHPTKQWFFSTGVDLVLSRYLRSHVPRAETMVGDDHTLKLLVVISQPDTLDPVLEQPVLEAIEKVAETNPLELSVLDVATVDNLLERLETFTPHVVHFIGHGRYNDAQNRAEIALLQPDEQSVDWIPEHSFAEYFPNAGWIPRLVFLHLCESARGDPRLGFAGFAPRLVLAGVQAVVAMQFPITNIAAIAFSRAFYRELAKGTPVDQAVQVGRWRITTSDSTAYDSRVFGTPVLYMRSRDGIIKPLTQKVGVTGAPSGP